MSFFIYFTIRKDQNKYTQIERQFLEHILTINFPKHKNFPITRENQV